MPPALHLGSLLAAVSAQSSRWWGAGRCASLGSQYLASEASVFISAVCLRAGRPKLCNSNLVFPFLHPNFPLGALRGAPRRLPSEAVCIKPTDQPLAKFPTRGALAAR